MALLRCGVLAGPLFISVVVVQDYLRVDGDSRQYPLSVLALGDWGWVQSLNFIVAGLLNLAYAVGLRRVLRPGRAARFGPLLIGLYGAGLVTVGIFSTDPADGFPRGAVKPPDPSPHAIVHALTALILFISLAIAFFVLSRRFAAEGEPRWAWYAAASGVALLATFFGGIDDQLLAARLLRLGVVIGWGGSALIAAHLLSRLASGSSSLATNTPSAGP